MHRLEWNCCDTLVLVSVWNSKSVYFSLSEEPYEELGATQSRDVVHPHSDGEWSPSER